MSTAKRKPKRASAKHVREAKMLTTLRNEHGFGWVRFPREADRYTYAMNLTTRTGCTKYVLKLIVPLDSALGEAMQKLDKRRDAQAKRAKTMAAKRRRARRLAPRTTTKQETP